MDAGKLDFDTYQQHALRTARDKEGSKALSTGGMGLGGEGAEFLELFLNQHERLIEAMRVTVQSGKLADYLKKVVHHDHPIDKEKVKKELGDLLWYIALTAHASGLTLNEVAEANVAKLKARFEKGFTVAESLNRKPSDS